jgi:hypothetical protein
MSKNILIISAVAIMLAGCSSAPAPTPLPTGMPNQLAKQTPGTVPAGYQIVLVQSVITTGPNRFAIGILKGDAFVKDAKLTLTFYDLTRQEPKVVGTTPATYREGPDGFTGIYTAPANFTSAGSWGVAVTGSEKDGSSIDQKAGFDVVASSTVLAIGKKAPSVVTPTLTSVGGDIKKLTSSPTPNPAFYQLSLDKALANGLPTVFQVSTPAFCSSRLCGPVYDVMSNVATAYSRQVNFVQVEVYKDLPNPNLTKPNYADAYTAFGLESEPWTFVMDKTGIVTWRAEGLIGADELKTEIDRVIAAS